MLLQQKMDDAEISSGFPPHQNPTGHLESSNNNPPVLKRKRNLPGNPDPEAEVIALSPKTLMATNRFLCEICGKGFQRDQNLQLHRRGHNLPWKLKQRTSKEPRKRVYLCPEKTCVHHDPSRALGDLTGIKKHFCRKHGEKKWKCEKCSKRYAVQSDWKAHSKTCGTKEYKCDCGTIFSRRDSFITHRAFCDALAEETARVNAASTMANSFLGYTFIGNSQGPAGISMTTHFPSIFKPISNTSVAETNHQASSGLSLWMAPTQTLTRGPPQTHHDTMVTNLNSNNNDMFEIHHQLGSVTTSSSSSGSILYGNNPLVSCPNSQLMNWVFGGDQNKNGSDHHHQDQLISVPSLYSSQHQQSHQTSSANMSATALLQKAAQIGATSTNTSFLGTLGLKCRNSSQEQEGNKFCGIYGTGSSILVSTLGSETTENPAKRRNIQHKEEISNNGGEKTRDFLGVGVESICHDAPINGWI
ncbi:hypothetical protein K1719_027257 [Acacia pycnantha]|nr:hypothetical protein K1719_027257 [Acacia pycnantha]